MNDKQKLEAAVKALNDLEGVPVNFNFQPLLRETLGGLNRELEELNSESPEDADA